MALKPLPETDHWNSHSRHWHRVGPPLRPDTTDVSTAEEMLQTIADDPRPRPAAALLLGVTPELAGMRWPVGSGLLAVDRSTEMIQGVLPRHTPVPLQAVCGEWSTLPLADSSIGYAAGDGCLTVLENPEALRALSAEVRRVLASSGGFVIRLFVQAAQPEQPDQVLADLLAGRIGNFHIFKWRLAMALHEGLDQGVHVRDIWRCWQDMDIPARSLSERLGWSVEEIGTIDAYRDAQARYTFSTLEEAREIFSEHFQEQDCRVPDYELGERCPTLLLAPRHE